MSSGESVVEAWGVRYGRQPIGDLLYPTAEEALRDADVGAQTVVPLIAADRLTDEALVEAVARKWADFEWDGYPEGARKMMLEMTAEHLAALRAHLESA